jgi:nitrogen fixation-related uncharacterized protein
MTALAIIIAVSLVAAVLGVAIAFFWADEDQSQHREPPTVDGGWRAFP